LLSRFKCNSCKSDETLEQASQGVSGGPIPGNIQGQAGRGSEQPDSVVDVPAHCRGSD